MKKILLTFAIIIYFTKTQSIRDECNIEVFNSENAVNLQNNLKNGDLAYYFDSLELTGEGSFGSVVNISWPEKKFSVKKMPLPDLENEESSLPYYEIQNLKKTQNSEYFLNFFECLYDDRENEGFLYILTETLFIDLSALDISEDLPQNEKLNLYKSLIKGLISLKNLNLVHNDIKPANIMFTDDKLNKVKLIDFGLSKNFEKLNSNGSLYFMTFDKLLNGRVPAKYQSDLVALGVTIGIIEFDDDFLHECLGKSFNTKFDMKMLFDKFHYLIADYVSRKYPYRLRKPKSGIRNMKDLLVNIMSSDLDQILDLEVIFEIFEELEELHTPANEHVKVILEQANKFFPEIEDDFKKEDLDKARSILFDGFREKMGLIKKEEEELLNNII